MAEDRFSRKVGSALQQKTALEPREVRQVVGVIRNVLEGWTPYWPGEDPDGDGFTSCAPHACDIGTDPCEDSFSQCGTESCGAQACSGTHECTTNGCSGQACGDGGEALDCSSNNTFQTQSGLTSSKAWSDVVGQLSNPDSANFRHVRVKVDMADLGG